MREFLIIFLLITALFLGLFPHDIHAKLFTKIFGIRVPPHLVYIILSVICFATAICLSQEDYFKALYNQSKHIAYSGERIVKATGKLIKSTAGNFNSFDDFVDTVESIVEGATD